MANALVSESAFELVTLVSADAVVSGSYLEMIVLPTLPSLSCGSPPVGAVGIPYSHTFPVVGGTAPLTFSVSSGSLPPGLTLNASTGMVSGTPTDGGIYPVGITVVDAALQSSMVDCSIVIGGSLSHLRVILRGVKRVRKGQEPDLCGCPEPAHVKQAR